MTGKVNKKVAVLIALYHGTNMSFGIVVKADEL